MKNILTSTGKKEILYQDNMFRVYREEMGAENGEIVHFTKTERSPGVRLLITKADKMLLTREYRYELKKYDQRLPGGKVFDRLGDYLKVVESGGDILKYAEEAARKECLEETGLIVKNIRHFKTKICGATVIWDLHYFLIDDFEKSKAGQRLEVGEDIHPKWYSFADVKGMCDREEINEPSTVVVLTRFLSGSYR